MGTSGGTVTNPAAPRWRMALLALAILTWLACFAVLRRWGTWTPFAVAGPTLAALALIFDTTPRALLRPSMGTVGGGLVAGALMVALTHVAFGAMTWLWPEGRAATSKLYDLLNVEGFTPAARIGLVAVIAACEEIVFRGALASGGDRDREGPDGVSSWRGLGCVVALAACYAAATLTLGSSLLVGCAFACGAAWGGLRLATRSLVAPIAAHIVWDLGVLVVWPLV